MKICSAKKERKQYNKQINKLLGAAARKSGLIVYRENSSNGTKWEKTDVEFQME